MMRLPLLSVVLVVGCVTMDHGTPPDRVNPPIEPAPGIFTEACAPQACATGAIASEPAHLEALIEGTESWVVLGDYTSGCLPASKDVPVSGTVTIRGADIAVPPGHEPRVRFRLRDLPAGVECIAPEGYWDFTLCDDITLRDTTVRLRMVLQDVHPAIHNFVPVVEVLPACETECGDDQLTCEATHTCWPTLRDHCAYCLGGDNEACACWDGESFEPDGTRCSFFITGDTIASGTCKAGSCVYN